MAARHHVATAVLVEAGSALAHLALGLRVAEIALALLILWAAGVLHRR